MRISLKGQKIYLDTCCLSRPFDNQIQDRIRQETEAITQIIAYVEAGHLHWIASEVLTHEVDKNANLNQRFQIQRWLTSATRTVLIGETERARGKQLELLGFSQQDALHLACAESGGAALFLTTDDRLLKIAKRCYEQLRIRVENPEIWLQEAT